MVTAGNHGAARRCMEDDRRIPLEVATMRRLAAPLSLLTLASGLLLWLAAVPIVSAGDPCYHDYVLPSDTSASTTQVKLLPCAYSPTVTVGSCRRDGDLHQRDRLHASRHGREPGMGLARRRGRARQDRQLHLRPGRHVPVRVRAAPRDVRRDHRRRRCAGGGGRAVRRRPAGAATANAESRPCQPDGRLILVGVLAGALLGGLVAWFVSRRGAGARHANPPTAWLDGV